MKVANPVDRAMLARIKARRCGWVFSAADFVDLGSRAAVDKALSRLAATAAIRRVARGLYHVPRHHPIVGLTVPGVDMVVKALARKTGARFQETGAYAANLLGLSDQVPAKVVLLTDGRSRHFQIGKLVIALKRTTPRNMATAGRTSGLVIQALRHIGKTRVGDDTVRRLVRVLSAHDRQQLSKDTAHAPAWVATIMRRVTGNR